MKENATPDEEWAALQQVVYNIAKTYLGKPDRKHQDRFDPNDQELQTLEQKLFVTLNDSDISPPTLWCV